MTCSLLGQARGLGVVFTAKPDGGLGVSLARCRVSGKDRERLLTAIAERKSWIIDHLDDPDFTHTAMCFIVDCFDGECDHAEQFRGVRDTLSLSLLRKSLSSMRERAKTPEGKALIAENLNRLEQMFDDAFEPLLRGAALERAAWEAFRS